MHLSRIFPRAAFLKFGQPTLVVKHVNTNYCVELMVFCPQRKHSVNKMSLRGL
mgnify:CR=1 FL=1